MGYSIFDPSKAIKNQKIMPIVKDKRQVIVSFGTGDVVISAAAPAPGELNTELVFSESVSARPIGEVCEESIGVYTDKLPGTVIRLQFNKLESLHVVKEILLSIEKDMELARKKDAGE